MKVVLQGSDALNLICAISKDMTTISTHLLQHARTTHIGPLSVLLAFESVGKPREVLHRMENGDIVRYPHPQNSAVIWVLLARSVIIISPSNLGIHDKCIPSI
eukprot:6205854-Pleurochrysis_carterae.AAC.1